MLQNDQQRKAYLHLLTNFIMAPPEKNININYDTTRKESTSTMSKEIVKYMISPAQSGEMTIETPALQLYSSLKKGMSEKTILNLSSRLCCERGYVIFNDMHKRLYMHIGHNVQLWADLFYSESKECFTMREKSMFEPKSKWKIYPNNILKIEAKE